MSTGSAQEMQKGSGRWAVVSGSVSGHANPQMCEAAVWWVQRARALEEFSGCFYRAALPMEEGECAQSLGKARRKEGSLHGLREMEY
jgi:hypothetical protein